MRQTFSDNKGQSLIGIVVVLVVVGLITGGLYFYLSSQIPKVSEITEKQEGEGIIPSPEKELPGEETTPPEETTQNEEIVPTCQNECSQIALKRCSGNGYQTCGNYDADNCLEWDSIIACPVNTICQNGSCIQQVQQEQKCADGTSYGQCSTNKPQYCDNGNLTNKASLCGCPSGYKISENQCILDTSVKNKKIGIVYISESNETYNANWRTDLYPNKSKIENALNDIFSKKGEKFVVDFLGEYRTNNLCWNPSRIAFIQESSIPPSPGKGGGGGGTMYLKMPASELSQSVGNYYCLGNYNYWTTTWSDCSPDRCEAFNNPDFPDQPCFRIKCGQKSFVLSLKNLSWIDPLLNEMQHSVSFSNYDYRIIVLGNAGPIIPQTGNKEKYYFDTVMTSGDIMGYYASSLKVIVMTENGVRIPSYYHYDDGATTWTTKFFMPGWQQIVHEILHQFGAVDVYEPGYFQQNPNRDEALKLEPESEVDKSIMANGWPNYCSNYQSTYSCTAQDTEKIYLDKFNRIKLGL